MEEQSSEKSRLLAPARGTVLITGATQGLGFECAKKLAEEGYHLLLAGRSQERGQEAAWKIRDHLDKCEGRAAAAGGGCDVLLLDLESLASVRACAAEYGKRKAEWPPLMGIVANAGAQFVDAVNMTKDGFETTFQVNHLSHWLLLHLLACHVVPNGGRIVIVSSGTHLSHAESSQTAMPEPVYVTAELLAHPPLQHAEGDDVGTIGRRAYTTSKLCNIYSTREFSRRLQPRNITVNAFDPGLMPGTGLARTYSAVERFAWNYVLPIATLFTDKINTATQSGANLAHLISSPELNGVTGKYVEVRSITPAAVLSENEHNSKDLWGTSATLTNLQQAETIVPL